MLAAGEEQRVGSYFVAVREPRGHALDLAHRNAALDMRARGDGGVEQQRIHPPTRYRQRGAGQGAFDAPFACKHRQPRDPLAIEAVGIDAKAVQCRDRAPAQETAAQRIAIALLSFEQQVRQFSLREPTGDRCACRTAADDQRRRSTHSRNGKARNTRASVMSASASNGGHSPGR